MIETSTLLIFAGAVMALLLSPGPNMAFVMAHGMAYGLRGGAAARRRRSVSASPIWSSRC